MECVTAGNVFVHLFFQTKPKYQLDNKKLQYLLCIAQFVSVSVGRCLFADSMRNLKNGFVLETIADTFTCNSNIQEGTTVDRKINMVSSDFHLPYSRKKLYEIRETVSEVDKALLIDVFINFGAYSEETLCKMLNEFAQLRNVPLWSYVSPEDVSSFFEIVFSDGSVAHDLKTNKVFLFCQENHNNACLQESNDFNNQNEKLSSSVVADSSIAVPEKVIKDVCKLEPYLSRSLTSMTVDKKYRIYIESKKGLKDVIVIALKDQSRIFGDLKQVDADIYCYSVMGTPSDIKVCCEFSDNS